MVQCSGNPQSSPSSSLSFDLLLTGEDLPELRGEAVRCIESPSRDLASGQRFLGRYQGEPPSSAHKVQM